jgi:hypothetical protein
VSSAGVVMLTDDSEVPKISGSLRGGKGRLVKDG